MRKVSSCDLSSCLIIAITEEAKRSNKRSRRNDDSELVELSEEGSHDESEAEMSGSDDEDDD